MATVAALVEACGQVLEQHGLGRLSTNRVAERAGASIGSLYQYFPAKEALLQALADRERAQLLAELTALASGLPPQAGQLSGSETSAPRGSGPLLASEPLWLCLHAMVGAGLRHQFGRPGMARALEDQDQTPASRAAAAAFDQAVSALLAVQLQAWAGRLGQDRPVAATPGDEAAPEAAHPATADAPTPSSTWAPVARSLIHMARALIHTAAPEGEALPPQAWAVHQQAITQAAAAYVTALAPIQGAKAHGM